MTRRHLVTVWNPSYASNAIEEHLGVLLHFAGRYDQGSADDDALYVWWGKVRSPNRQQPQAHAQEIREIGREVAADADAETHLYLTDYQSLYVGHLAEVVEGELPASEAAHVPPYYGREQLACDFWFRLEDIRRLVSDDLLGVIAETKKLRNVHYADRPVSLYGGMVDLPLVVTRPDGERFFDAGESDALTDGRLWAEFDAAGSGTGVAATERELRDNLFGEAAWSALEPVARTFIATGEKVFRDHRGDPAFDFAPALGSFAKALEVQCNAALRRGLAKAKPAARLANIDGRTVDVRDARALTLGQLARAIGGERALNAALSGGLEHGGWFAGQLPAILDAFAQVRNPATHEARLDRRTATQWRDRLLGVGCQGVLVELALVRGK
ncbi:MAG: hypothetical protein WKG32_13605 [Gemmatimonadaceae bacterium]